MPQVNQLVQQLIQPFIRLGGGRNPRAYTQGLIPYRQKQWSRAVEYFTKATVEQPDHAPSHFKLGMSHFRLKKYEAALENITQALDLDPSQKQWQAQLEQTTRYAIKKVGITTAEKENLILEQMKRLDIPTGELYHQLANIYRKKSDRQKEIESLQQAVASDNFQPTWFYRLGEALELDNRFSQAAVAYQKAIAIKGEQVEASWYYRLGFCLEKESDDKSIIEEAYSKAVLCDKKLNAKRYGIGVFHHDCGAWFEAQKSYIKTLEQQPFDEELCYRIGVVSEYSSHWNEAERYYKKALSIEFNQPIWHFRLGLVLEYQEKYEESFSAYQYAIFISRFKKPYWLYRSAIVQQKLANYELSCKLYIDTRDQATVEKNIDLDSSDQAIAASYVPHQSLKKYINNFRNNEHIAKLLINKLNENSENYKLWYQLGKLHERGEKWRAAADAYLAAVDKNNGYSKYWFYRLGYSLYQLSEYEQASQAFSMMMNSEFNSINLKNKVKIKICNIEIIDNVYRIEIVVIQDKEISNFSVNSLSLDARETFDNENISVKTKTSKAKHDGNKIYCFFDLDLTGQKLGFLYHDLYIEGNIYFKDYIGAPVKFKASLASDELVENLKNYPLYKAIRKDNMIFYPYITASGKSMAFINREIDSYDDNNIYEIEKEAIEEFEKNKQYYLDKKSWLIFEKFSKTAQDNAYYFFIDIVNKRPNVYYVIEKDSPDRQYLHGHESNVVEFMSKEHMLLLLSCELMISSETRGHVYAWRRVFGKFREAVFKKPYVFLQHGVTAMKKNDINLAKTSHICAADKFVVSCDFEKKIILRDNFGYSESDLIVSGFPRWNTLIDKSEEFNEIFIMPTWRNWLEGLNDDEFKESEYFKEYAFLLSTEKLSEILERNNFKVNFYLHPKIIQQLKNFNISNSRVNLIQFGEYSVRELLMRSKLLITDYSSVAWDFYYLKKPVIFYHFDVQKYLKFHGAHIDFNSELPGVSAHNNSELILLIEKMISNYNISKNEANKIGDFYFGEVMGKNSSNVIYKELLSYTQ